MVLIIISFFASIITSVLAYNAYGDYSASSLYYDAYKLGIFDNYLGTPSDTKYKLLLFICIVCWISFIVSIIIKIKNENKVEKKEIICKKCGVPNVDGSKHCKNCGAELNEQMGDN